MNKEASSFNTLKEIDSDNEYLILTAIDLTISELESKVLAKVSYLKRSDNGKHEIIKSAFLVELEADYNTCHKINSCIDFNNAQLEKAYEALKTNKRKHAKFDTDDSPPLLTKEIKYLNFVILTYCDWFNKNGIEEKININFLYHSEDYASVTLLGKTFTLTPSQRIAIRILHEAYLSGNPQLSIKYICEKLDEERDVITSTRKLSKIFQDNMDAYRHLVIQGKIKGTLAINL